MSSTKISLPAKIGPLQREYYSIITEILERAQEVATRTLAPVDPRTLQPIISPSHVTEAFRDLGLDPVPAVDLLDVDFTDTPYIFAERVVTPDGSAALPDIPRPLVATHWLAVDGAQPIVPQNPSANQLSLFSQRGVGCDWAGGDISQAQASLTRLLPDIRSGEPRRRATALAELRNDGRLFTAPLLEWALGMDPWALTPAAAAEAVAAVGWSINAIVQSPEANLEPWMGPLMSRLISLAGHTAFAYRPAAPGPGQWPPSHAVGRREVAKTIGTLIKRTMILHPELGAVTAELLATSIPSVPESLFGCLAIAVELPMAPRAYLISNIKDRFNDLIWEEGSMVQQRTELQDILAELRDTLVEPYENARQIVIDIIDKLNTN